MKTPRFEYLVTRRGQQVFLRVTGRSPTAIRGMVVTARGQDIHAMEVNKSEIVQRRLCTVQRTLIPARRIHGRAAA